MQEYARLGFFDPRNLFHEDGSPKPIQELDDDTAAVLAGLEVVEIREGKGDDRHSVGYLEKYKLADKRGTIAGTILGAILANVSKHSGKLSFYFREIQVQYRKLNELSNLIDSDKNEAQEIEWKVIVQVYNDSEIPRIL